MKKHTGFILAVLLTAVFWKFPFFDGGIFPDPWETLFDWAGVFFAHTYLAILYFVLNFGWIFVVAGIFDRCPLNQGIPLIALMALGIPLLRYGDLTWSFVWLVAFIFGLLAIPLYAFPAIIRKRLAKRLS